MAPSIDYQAIRRNNLAILEQRHFRPAGSLPFGPREENAALRSLEEIAKRLWSLNILFLYVSDFGKPTPSAAIQQCVSKNGLSRWMPAEEAPILKSWRWFSRSKYIDSIGWKLENMLALAWILGFESAPELDGIMVGGELRDRLVFEFLGDPGQDLDDWLARRSPRSELEVIEMEDLFYCAHNAVRCAQFGEDNVTSPVPDNFHPAVNGGVIHERRHSLTWSISPGVSWDEADLNT